MYNLYIVTYLCDYHRYKDIEHFFMYFCLTCSLSYLNSWQLLICSLSLCFCLLEKYCVPYVFDLACCPFYECFLVYLCIDHLLNIFVGWFYFVGIINKGVMNTHLRIFVWACVCVFHLYLYGKCMLNFPKT